MLYTLRLVHPPQLNQHLSFRVGAKLMLYPLREAYPAGEHPTLTKIVPLKICFAALGLLSKTIPGHFRCHSYY